MKISKKKLVEVLEENFYVNFIFDDYYLHAKYETPVEEEDNVYTILARIVIGSYESYVIFHLDATNYDKKFIDVNKYEVDDMGVIISLCEWEGEPYELSLEGIWKTLFFNKEKVEL